MKDNVEILRRRTMWELLEKTRSLWSLRQKDAVWLPSLVYCQAIGKPGRGYQECRTNGGGLELPKWPHGDELLSRLAEESDGN